MAIQCPKCRIENSPDSKFCKECATPLPPTRETGFAPTGTLVFPREGLAPGTVIADRYQIIEELGRGGMGKIYKVFDEITHTHVALKLIRPEVAADQTAVERFRNELNVARTISHKHICRMYDLGREGGCYFITMEVVSGEDLRSLIKRTKRLDVGTAVSLASQVCEGLAEAHRLGVVHRDLKPGNIMVDKEGDAKIMDFGIARSLRTKGFTGPGTVIGTAEYMSPEQVDGKEADPRADLYALTVILYEMVTGRVPFVGETAFAVGLMQKSQPPENPKRLNPLIPDDLSRLILKGLEKDREKRFQAATEMLAELTKIGQGLPTAERTLTERGGRPSRERRVKALLQKLRIPAVALGVVALATVFWVLLARREPAKPPILPLHRQLTFTGEAAHPAISPDGRSIAYVTGRRETGYRGLVQDRTGGRPVEVFTGEGYRDLLWTPDGAEITVVEAGGVFLSPRLGGPRRRLEAFEFIAWSPDGLCYAGARRSSRGIAVINKSTGASKTLGLRWDFLFILGLAWSPVGDRLVVLTINRNNRYSLWTMKTDGGLQNMVREDQAFLSSPRWAPKGDAVFYLRGQVSRDLMTELWKLPISRDTGRAARLPALVLSGIPMGGSFTLSSDGRYLLYTLESFFSNLWLARVQGPVTNRTVSARPLTSGTSVHEDFSVSPDGKRLAFSRGDGKTMNIFVMSLEGGSPVQLTFFNCRNSCPVWSPDGQEIAFGSNEGGTSKVWKISTQGGTAHQFSKSALSETHHVVWAPGPRILYQKIGNRNYQLLDPRTEEEAPLVKDDSVGWMFMAAYSPDGKKLAVYWNRQPTAGLWIISLEDRTGRFTGAEGIDPLGWSLDGNWIYGQKEADYVRVNSEAPRIEPLPTIPFSIEGEIHHMPADDRTRVFISRRSQSDVWIVENFDQIIR